MTATRENPYTNLNMSGIGDKKSKNGLGTAFGSGSFLPSKHIWNSTSSGRDIDTRGSDETPSANFPPLTSNSDSENPWKPLWSTTEPMSARSASGTTSPNRSRDDRQQLPTNGGGPYYDMNSHNGQRQRRMLPEEDKENFHRAAYGSGQAFGNYEAESGFAMRADRGSQDPIILGSHVFGPSSRDNSLPPSRHSHEEFFGPSDRHTPSGPMHSHRPSIPSHSSFTTNNRSYLQNKQLDEQELADHMGRSLRLDERLHSAVSNPSFQGLPAQSQYPLSPLPTWQPEPSPNGLSDAYSDSAPSQFSHGNKRGSADRITPSPAPSYRVMSSPRSGYQSPSDAWPRPSSRDPRTAPELDARRGGYPPHQMTFYPPQHPHLYGQGFHGQFGAHLDPYGQQLRPPVVPGFGLPVGPFIPGVPSHMRHHPNHDPAKGMRSLLLEEFKTSKSTKKYELKDIYNHVVEFSGDQHGSRFIQQKLETANSDEKAQVFLEIDSNAVQLMKDVFGNYVVQKFFEHGNQLQKKHLAGRMKGKVLDLSVQMYACRVVQKALEHVLVEQQAELVKELEPNIMTVVKDQNGNHVVQKIIELVPREYIGFIMDSFRGQVSSLAAHAYGCRVVQRMLEHGGEEDKASLLCELHQSAGALITDQYGNYVMQHVIEHGQPRDRTRLISQVTSQILTLSKHKFASNVVEKCIENGNAEERRKMTESLTMGAPGPDGTHPLLSMMKDQFGNYVIQKLLQRLQGEERDDFIRHVVPHLPALKKMSAPRQVAALEKLLVPSPEPRLGSISAPTAPASSQFHGDARSSAPTPALTIGQNSPQSSSPPSTKSSSVGDATDAGAPGKTRTRPDLESKLGPRLEAGDA